MLTALTYAAALVAVTVAIHAAGMGWVLAHVMKSATIPTRLWPIAWMLIRVAWFLLLIHGAEISVWALFYWWQDCLSDAESAFYFSGVTYTTTGYGDVVLKQPWRMLAPIEAATGILMCALSAGLFFATVNRIYSPRVRGKE